MGEHEPLTSTLRSVAFVGLLLYTFAIVSFWANVGTVGMVVAFVGVVIGWRGLRAAPVAGLFALYLAWAALTSFFAPYGEVARAGIDERVKLLVILVVVAQALNTPNRLYVYLLFFTACYLLFPVRGVFVGGDSVQGRRVWNYVYSNPNDLAAISLLALGAALAIALGSTRRARLWRLARACCAGTALAILAVILLTQSRGAFVGLIAGYATAVLPSGAKDLRRTVLVGVVLTGLVALLPENVWTRVAGMWNLRSSETVAQADWEGSAAQRLEIQEAGLRLVADHWFAGVGLDAFPAAIGAYAPRLARRDAHNTYLNVAGETGIPGLLIWLALFAYALARARRARKMAPHSELAKQQQWIERGIVSYLVAGVFGTFSAINFSYLMLAVLAGSTSLLVREIALERRAGTGR